MNITYIFGAGASKHALPLVSEIRKGLIELAEKVNSTSFSSRSNDTLIQGGRGVEDVRKILSDDLKWLTENIEDDTIDNFAKSLHIRQRFNDVKKLKVLLSLYFTLLQNNRKVDRRYNTFFVQVLDSAETLKPNIKILSWNYDFQFELAFRPYSGNDDIFDNQKRLMVYSKNSRHDGIRKKGFSIYKLNGTTAFDNFDTGTQYLPQDVKTVENFITEYDYLTLNVKRDLIRPALSFAWEPDDAKIINLAKTDTADTEVLVVIGYTFPFFNRDQDRQLIGSMRELKKVYFQDPHPDVPIDGFNAAIFGRPGKIEIAQKTNCDSFLLPPELNIAY